MHLKTENVDFATVIDSFDSINNRSYEQSP